MKSLAEKLKKNLYFLNWDTGGRNLDVVKAIKPLLQENSNLLDAGCGEYGLAPLIPSIQVTGIDLVDSKLQTNNFTFYNGSIVSLPFPKESFSIAASVDVLEHLPIDIRKKAVTELIRVARDAIIFAFPSGEQARQIDEDFATQLNQSNKSQPPWLVEHLDNPYPELDTILSMIETEAINCGKKAQTKMFYSENIKITKLLRKASIRSSLIYLTLNALTGLIRPLLSSVNKHNSYRVILIAKFK